ncbi:MAG: ATP phosphoribosyltransferase regulatory subunit [Micavibrio sp.]|nr:ATP phosphoribosyltransferase regulatory subunit [Micavibrio sp.]
MKNENKNIALLPAGFEDLLPPYAEGEYVAISNMMKVFSSFGYERVKPPMAEFEETMLGTGPGAALSANTFRLMDPASHKMMALRSDITAQIARIASSRLVNASRPLRLAYANDVIRTRTSQNRAQRQFTQVGCEMVGADDVNSDVEIAVLAIKALAASGIQDITIDFSLPQIVDDIFKVSNVSEQKTDELRAQLAGVADVSLKALDSLNLPDHAVRHLARLKDVIAGVRGALEALHLASVNITIDPLETKGFEYHKCVVFTLFAQNIRGELGRGGRYNIGGDSEDNETANGFTIYMDTIRQGLGFRGAEKVIAIEVNNWGDAVKLQRENWITILGAPTDRCTHIYKNGKIEEL